MHVHKSTTLWVCKFAIADTILLFQPRFQTIRSRHVHAETEPRIPLSPANTSLPPFARSNISPPPTHDRSPLLPTPRPTLFFLSPRLARRDADSRPPPVDDFRVENRGVGRGDRGREVNEHGETRCSPGRSVSCTGCPAGRSISQERPWHRSDRVVVAARFVVGTTYLIGKRR